MEIAAAIEDAGRNMAETTGMVLTLVRGLDVSVYSHVRYHNCTFYQNTKHNKSPDPPFPCVILEATTLGVGWVWDRDNN